MSNGSRNSARLQPDQAAQDTDHRTTAEGTRVLVVTGPADGRHHKTMPALVSAWRIACGPPLAEGLDRG
jgi:hypothetical protein